MAVRRRFVHAHYRGIHKFQDVQRAESRSQELPRRSSLGNPPFSPYNGQSAPGALGPPARRGCSPLAGAPTPSAPRSRTALTYPSAPTTIRSCSETAGGQRRRASSERGLCSLATRRADGRGGPGGSAPRGAAKPAVTWAPFPVSALPGPRVAPEPDVAAPGNAELSYMKTFGKKKNPGTTLVAQWLRIRLPMQGTQVQSLVREDPTCRGATKPVRHNY
ncbi:hypothetical protein J1605_010207 [Eschrichtius robustus]|uniref:Uncharacterized protein n=1 Tax=Eschrichtius robustus TaxID=9764 RepID=A0AB34GSG5_ESCRO|nr:hypothetical protein J1605_010207 [Eschrichtius robustus]